MKVRRSLIRGPAYACASATHQGRGGNLKQQVGLRGTMTTDRKFTRFNPVERAVTTSHIPEGGFCLSSFVVISQTGHPERILMGHLNPAAAWDHVGALDQERAETN